MEVTADSLRERNDSFVIKQIDDCDVTQQPVRIAVHSDDVIGNNTDGKDIMDALKVDNNGSAAGLKNRKNKPPNLNISPRFGERLSCQITQDQTQIASVDDDDDKNPPGDVNASVILRKRNLNINESTGRSSPVVKRSSMLEKILEIPDVKAALVKDEGYEMLRRRSHESVPAKPIADRQPTPACSIDADRFNFEPQSPDIDSESITESDTSSVHSSVDASVEGGAPNRPHVEVLKDSKRVTNLFERIADSTGPSTVFGSPLKKDSGSIPSPLLRKKRRKKTLSTEEEEDSTKPTTPKSRALLSRLKFASMGRNNSNSSLEGWDSLARALARVGSTSTSLTTLDPANLHPKLSPILKRHSPAERWSNASSCSSQVLLRNITYSDVIIQLSNECHFCVTSFVKIMYL